MINLSDVAHKRKCALSLVCLCNHAVFAGDRKKLVGVLSVVCTAYYILEPYFFHAFLKFKWVMPAVSSMTTPLRVYMLRIYGAAAFVLAINSLKM